MNSLPTAIAVQAQSLAQSRTSRSERFLFSKGWTVYLILAVALLPVVKPEFQQVVILDAVNVLAMLIFLGCALAQRTPLEVPLAIPVCVISIGTLLGLVNAENMAYGLVTVVQDAYLYLWFVCLVNIMKVHPSQRTVRIAWLASAAIMGLIGLAMLLTDGRTHFFMIFGARGNRAWALFQSPNTFADYLMMSVFVGLSLLGQMSFVLLSGLLGAILLALVATKSNGAMGAMVVGLVAWTIVRAATRRGSVVPVLGMALFLSGVLTFGLWAQREFNPSPEPIEAIGSGSFIGRMGHSSESRHQIWNNLMRHWAARPQGIGAGNSKFIRLSVGERERRFSYFSKEPHNDYIGYLVERGPIALAAMLVLLFQPLVLARKQWKASASRVWRKSVASPLMAALIGGVIASAVHSFVMEKLHFRHFWFFMALLCAIREPVAAKLSSARDDAPEHDDSASRAHVVPAASGFAPGRGSLAEAV